MKKIECSPAAKYTLKLHTGILKNSCLHFQFGKLRTTCIFLYTGTKFQLNFANAELFNFSFLISQNVSIGSALNSLLLPRTTIYFNKEKCNLIKS